MDNQVGFKQPAGPHPNKYTDVANVPGSRLSHASHITMGPIALREGIAPTIPKKENDGKLSAAEKRQRNRTIVGAEAFQSRQSSMRRDYSYASPWDQNRLTTIAGGFNPDVSKLGKVRISPQQ